MKKVAIVLAVVFINSIAAAEEITYLDLIKRLTDMERLAMLPAPGETCGQCSSYDRASRYDAKTDKYINWDANGDGQGFIRREGDQIVMAEMTGPGCIWRIWSADAKAGHVKIYLDGAAEPAIDLPFSGYFDRKNEPFTGQALVHNASSGLNCCVLIPYQKSCKIVADKGWGNYSDYNIFAAGTPVMLKPDYHWDSWGKNRTLAEWQKIFNEDLHSRIVPISYECAYIGFQLFDAKGLDCGGPLPEEVTKIWKPRQVGFVGSDIRKWGSAIQR